jgi:hypothetical protein
MKEAICYSKMLEHSDACILHDHVSERLKFNISSCHVSYIPILHCHVHLHAVENVQSDVDIMTNILQTATSPPHKNVICK